VEENEQKQVHDRFRNSLMPYINNLVQKVEENGRVCITGFIYGYPSDKPDADPYLQRFGNISTEGGDYIRLTMGLAAMTVDLQARGLFEEDIIEAGEKGADPLSLADKLAVMLMAVPLDQLPKGTSELVDAYLEARRNG
jgi:hypothetical protein